MVLYGFSQLLWSPRGNRAYRQAAVTTAGGLGNPTTYIYFMRKSKYHHELTSEHWHRKIHPFCLTCVRDCSLGKTVEDPPII